MYSKLWSRRKQEVFYILDDSENSSDEASRDEEADVEPSQKKQANEMEESKQKKKILSYDISMNHWKMALNHVWLLLWLTALLVKDQIHYHLQKSMRLQY